MKKIKGLLFAFVALFAFTIAMVTAKAETETIVTKATIDSASVTKDGITFTSSGMKTGVSITGTSLIDGTEKTYTTGTKLNDGATLTFTTSYNWSAQILFGSAASSESVATNNGTASVTTANTIESDKKTGTAGVVSITGGTPGDVTLRRGGSKEVWILEIVLTQVKNLDAEYVNVYFHDVEGNAGAATPVEKGTKATAAAAAPILGKKFVNWTLEDGTTFDFNTAINEETHLYPQYVDLDLNVTNASNLSKDYLNSLLSVWSSMPSIADTTALPDTNYSLVQGANLMNNDSKKFPGESEAITYGINTGGAITCTEEGVWKNAIKFEAPSAGTFTIYGRSGSSDNRSAVILAADQTTVATSDPVSQDNIVKLSTLSVNQAGTYYIGCTAGGFKFYSIEFEAQQPAPEPSVNFVLSTGYNNEGAELVRFIVVIDNISEEEWMTNAVPNMKAVLTGEGLGDEGLDISCFRLANRLTVNGEDLVVDEVSYGVQENRLYFVAVIAVSNYGELAEDYVGKEITLHVYLRQDAESNWEEYPEAAASYTVLGAQA